MPGSRFDDFTRSMATSRRGFLATLVAGATAGLAHLLSTTGQSDEPLTERDAARATDQAARESERATEQAQRDADRATRQAESAAAQETRTAQHASDSATRQAEQAAAQATREAERASDSATREAEQATQQAQRDAAREARSAFSRVGNSCDRGQPCGSMAPCSGGICTPIACSIDGQIWQPGDLDPNNDCQVCFPPTSWDAWSLAAEGALCLAELGEPCQSGMGHCERGQCIPDADPNGTSCGTNQVCCEGACCAAGECCQDDGMCGSCEPACRIDEVDVPANTPHPTNQCLKCDPTQNERGWSPLDDQTTCGTTAGRVCCNGECCSPTECCVEAGYCQECGPHCRIGGADIDAGVRNPQNDCEECDPDRNVSGWSRRANDAECDGILQVCCNGICCPPEQCCVDGDACGECPCVIDGRSYQAGRENPQNACQECNPRRNPNGWSVRGNGIACGPGGNRTCCEGDCCPSGECCVLDACGECPCRINGVDYGDGDWNDNNFCEICDTSERLDGWIAQPDGEACKGDPTRECCDGRCCPAGQCCVDGECAACDCQIGDGVAAGTVNSNNSCEICDPARNLYDWSAVDPETSCGADRVCCDRDCCETGECCLLDACGTCLCHIGGTNYGHEASHPTNSCLYCNTDADTEDWSIRQDGFACGADRVCCSAECCDDGLCCVQGSCTVCGCWIGDERVPEGTINPENNCQLCDPNLNAFGWSPNADDTYCGDLISQVCCNGECCAPSLCCSLESTCVECECLIDNTFYANGTTNPDNLCEECNTDLDRFGWTSITGEGRCGDGALDCCNGACCEADQCCVLGACGQCPCEIDGTTWQVKDRNPDNDCEWCNPEVDREAWTLVDNDEVCEDAFNRVCCEGTCCEDDLCCIGGLCSFCGCVIDGVEYEIGANPSDGNVCQECDPKLDPIAFTLLSDTPCGDGDEQICCHGACCEPLECCGLGDFCVPCRCEIDGVVYERNDPHPTNDCLRCLPESSTTSWSSAEPNAACGIGGGQFCCAGECCEGGQCCHAREGTCGAPPCECLIANTEYREGATNPNNPCEVCNPHEVSDLWSPIDDGVRCNAPLEGVRECCGGVCCAEDECCRGDGSCGECVCEIGVEPNIVFWARAAANPENECEICSPTVDPFDWTPMSDGTSCGPDLTSECCAGECKQTCEVECRPAGPRARTAGCDGTCDIEGIVYDGGERNPANDCEFCDPSESNTSWTEAPFYTKCGEAFDRQCCAGSCCPEGDCCSESFAGSCSREWCELSDPCEHIEPCGCTIDGTLYQHGDENPNNSCQYCSTWWSETDWTSKGNNLRCGEFEDQFCCNDVCCPDAGTCCNSEGICEFEASFSCRGCVIGARFYRNFEENPANKCQICDTSQSTTSWTTAPNSRRCGLVELPDGFFDSMWCCEGVCCDDASLCCSSITNTCVSKLLDGFCQYR